MLRDLFLSLLSSFVIEPFLADLDAQLKTAHAPQAIIAQVQACAAAAPSALAERAAADPWWGISTVVGVAIGTTAADAVIAGAAPDCAAAVTAVRPFITATGA